MSRSARVGSRVWCAALLLAALALELALPARAQAPRAGPPLTLLSREGRRTLPTTIVNGQEMVGLDDLAGVFQLSVREDRLAGGLTVSYKGRTVVLTDGQSIASVGGRLVTLPAPPVRDARGWSVPIDFIGRALAPIYDTRLEFRRPSRFVVIGDVRAPHIAVRYEPGATQMRIVFDLTPPATHAVTQEAGRLIVRFDADALDLAIPQLPATDLVRSVQLVDPGTAVAIELGPKFGGFRAADAPAEAGGARLTVDITAAATIEAPPAPPSAEPPPLFEAPQSSIRTIVIDPGHGGSEDGARGPGGTLEKQVTLGVARRLKGALEGRLGVRVILTRDGDHTVALDERAALANNNKADVFLSLHANASMRSTAAGAEVFYLSLDAYGEEAKKLAVADAQPMPVFGGGLRDIEVILWEMAQVRHMAQSATFATLVEAQLRARVAMSPRALQQAPFRVLVGANMPAVLVEMGFLTNPEQERQLAGDAFQNSVVQALFDALVRFRDRLDAARNESAPSRPGATGADTRPPP